MAVRERPNGHYLFPTDNLRRKPPAQARWSSQPLFCPACVPSLRTSIIHSTAALRPSQSLQYTYTQTHTYTYNNEHTATHTPTHTRSHTHTHAHSDRYTCTHMDTSTQIHRAKHTHTHTHKCTRGLPCPLKRALINAQFINQRGQLRCGCKRL